MKPNKAFASNGTDKVKCSDEEIKKAIANEKPIKVTILKKEASKAKVIEDDKEELAQ